MKFFGDEQKNNKTIKWVFGIPLVRELVREGYTLSLYFGNFPLVQRIRYITYMTNIYVWGGGARK